MKHFSQRIALFIVVLLVLPVSAVFAQSSSGVVLTEFTDHAQGFSGVMPEGWTQAAPGTYRRLASQTDIALILQQAALGFAPEMVSQGLLQQLGQEALPEVVATVETEALSWDVYNLSLESPALGTVAINLALAAIDNPLVTYVVVLQSVEDEHDALYETVFLPTLEAFAPFTLNWGRADGPAPIDAAFEPVQLVPEVLDVRPHDPTSYTQGLLLHDGSLYESGGRYGASTLREVDPQTGEVIRMVEVPEEYFAEGLERVDDRLIQLTWKENEAFVYDLESFEQVDTYTYEGEGWGLCSDGELLYMSNGSAFLSLRDPETFDVVDYGLVTFQGLPADSLNELECVGDYIYANVYTLDIIVQIDKSNGNVVSLIDASGLLDEEQRAALKSDEVLNGIVYLPESETFLITGKHWPSMFEVTFEEAAEETE